MYSTFIPTRLKDHNNRGVTLETKERQQESGFISMLRAIKSSNITLK